MRNSLPSSLSSTYGVEPAAVRDLRLRDARDRDILLAARDAQAIILTKDRDMADLVTQLRSPPQILWLTCGNTSNIKLKSILAKAWPVTEELLKSGKKVVEISDPTG